MSTMPAQPLPGPMQQPRPQIPGTAGGNAAVATIDPFKLLNKHKWLLAGCVVMGVIFGVAMHLVLLRVAPVYKPKAVFECQMAPTTIQNSVANAIVPKDDYERFLQSEVARIKSDPVLRKVVEDQRVIQEAGT